MPRKLFLLTGIPGTGKTTIGDWLSQEHGFLHINAEGLLNADSSHYLLIQYFDQALLSGRDVVISWGFWPGQDDPDIQKFRENGFKLVWFDGNRDAALREFLRRGPFPPEAAFHAQIKRINESRVIERLKPIRINTFTETGSFKTVEVITQELFAAQAGDIPHSA